jgi:uncharacterized caspase-like protein
MSRRSRLFALLLGALLGSGVVIPGLAQADVRRYAFLIGSNKGAPHETPLRYAEADVHAVAEALIDLGGFSSEKVVRLVGASANRVRSALLELNLAIQRDLRAGGEAVLFVYYSGHADAQNLHLGGTELPTQELSSLVRVSSAKLKILLLDACRSGTLTRVKGGRPVAPFQIGVQDLLRNEGYAIITSSTAGEDAQESDALRSSIFTHHFLAGLRGPADVNGDRLVTLGEVYTYAAEQTLKTSLTTVAGSQHATFDYDLRGRADPVLADLRSRGERAELVLTASGEYLVMAGDSGALLVEAAVRAAPTSLQLAAGRYQVRLRARTNVYQTNLTLRTGESRSLGPAQMRPLPLAQVVRKGETDAVLASGPTVAATVHGPLGRGFTAMTGIQAGWAFELPRVTLVPRFGWGQSHVPAPAGDFKTHTLRELSLELAALYVFDLGPVAVAPLVSLGWGFYHQRLEGGSNCLDAICSTVRRPQGLITGVGGWAGWSLGRGFALESSLELANFYLSRQQDKGALSPQGEISGSLTYRAVLGLGYRY